jgi:hypothetical protein
MRRVQALLGHASVLQTEKYLGIELERRQRNEMLAGKTMFPGMYAKGTVRRLEAI